MRDGMYSSRDQHARLGQRGDNRFIKPDMDAVSIVVVCYNECLKRIKYTLESIIAQSYPAVELVVIDGGSGNETLAALEIYKGRIDAFISERDDGLYDAMNKGVGISQGGWIMFMNIGDRFYSTDVLSKIMKSGRTEDNSLVYGDVCGGHEILKAPDHLSRCYLFYQTVCHQSLLVRRAVFNSVGGFDLSYALLADRDWIYRAVTKGHKYAHLPMAVCDWELGGRSADYSTLNRELKRYHLKYFSRIERIMYSIIWCTTRILRRIRALNFALPVGIRDTFRDLVARKRE
jgi:glycosyltransferase involved in cell wall biosynthesis